MHSSNVPNGILSAGHGGSSTKGHGASDVGVGLSAEAYRRRHEISVSVSISNQALGMIQ